MEAHRFKIGDSVRLIRFPEEGEWSITQLTENILGPCYSARAADGATIENVSETYLELSPQSAAA